MSTQQKITKVSYIEYQCDICGKQSKGRKCTICKKDLCSGCIVWDDRDHGDYPPPYCESCWDTGKEYRQKMRELEDECDKLIEEQEIMWHQKAIEKK